MVYQPLCYLSNLFRLQALKIHTHLHCVYFPPDCKNILTKLGRYAVFSKTISMNCISVVFGLTFLLPAKMLSTLDQ